MLNQKFSEGYVKPIYINISKIVHVKHFQNAENNSALSQSFVDTSVDWYLLSLANKYFAYRIDGSAMYSTFLQTASRVSLHNPTKESEEGKTSLLKKSIYGNLVWSEVWDWDD